LEIEWLAPSGDTGLSEEDESAFGLLVDQVQKQFELTPVYKSKFVRGLESVLAQAHDNHFDISPEMTLEAAGRLLLHQQLFQINLNEHGVRYSKKIDYVHDMRVAIRRALAAMKLCQHAIPAKTLAPHIKGLRRVGRALGAVRDLDVAMSNLRDFGRGLPEGQRQALKRVRATLSSRRANAHADLIALLDSKKHRKFVVEFSAFCATPSSVHVRRGEASYEFVPSEVRHCVASIILRAFEAVRCYEVAFRGDQLPVLDSYHALRIQTKYLRYLLEFTQHLLGRDGETLITQLQGLQELLGELNDAHVEQERFHEWADKVKKDDALREAIAARLSQSGARIEELRVGTPARLNDFVKATTRRKLATALASI
jgi:CHAD domain-containing protein